MSDIRRSANCRDSFIQLPLQTSQWPLASSLADHSAKTVIQSSCTWATFSVKPPHASYSIHTAAQIVGNRSFGAAHRGHQDNGAIAKDIGRCRAHSQLIQVVPLGIFQSYCSSHDNLPAVPPPSFSLLTRSSKRDFLYESFCVST